ncbi:tRNA pseudouridine(13) synthase TruD [Aliidiomarina sanyensis]|uniref:tRNA pseudouridine synthase D n=1 Tax=Aliidiomarina sanyensis TaxID=1249555 RepID=A0A432WRQ6_9GAMM|nr:tRNA pseudouridine(13) synthase TruD [Aliidiomarina sanyensis]RUO36357.1 tRNA pseudouridine(13) synthase TruD [Aliidiomarina sanyensis]
MSELARWAEVDELQRGIAIQAGEVLPTGVYKSRPEDFEVIEQLGFVPEQNPKGQQHWLRIKKVGVNTEDLAKQLSKALRIHPRDLGYSGLKDKHAVTEQWMSVQLPALDNPDWSVWWTQNMTSERLRGGSAELLEVVRSSKKLRRGTHKANLFRLCVRDISNPETLQRRLEALAHVGSVPNYFGPQRFGRRGDNVTQALAMARGDHHVRDRNLRSILLSSIRSWLFNTYVHRRLTEGFPAITAGDVVILSGSQSYFTIETLDDVIRARHQTGDILVSGPLYGDGESPAQGAVKAFEDRVAADYPELVHVLRDARMKAERRALALSLSELRWDWLEEQTLQLSFALPAGSFATSVLTELGDFQEASHANIAQQ